jgi:Undecaprenyl-phosphate glucose phosphotransferase
MLDEDSDQRQNRTDYQKQDFGDRHTVFDRRQFADSTRFTGDTAFSEWLRHHWVKGIGTSPNRPVRILNQQVYAAEVLLLDVAVIVLMSLAAGVVYDFAAFGRLGDISAFLRSGLLVSVLFFGLARLQAARLPFGTSLSYERARDGLSTWAAAFALFLFIAFMLKSVSQLSRGATFLFFALGSVAVVVSRINGPLFATRVLKRRALTQRDIIVIGPRNDRTLSKLVAELRRTACENPYALVFDASASSSDWPNELRGVLTRATRYANSAQPGEILVVGGKLSDERLSAVLDGLAEIPRTICLVPDAFTSGCLHQKITAIGESVALEVQRAPLDTRQRVIKRAIDVVLSAFAIAFLAPALAAIAIAIKRDSPGPVLFRQARTGCRGRAFKILKFRTMTVLEDGLVVPQACKNDERMTRLGAWLRRTSLDELPQLFNVFKGDMSLIGPRPHAVAHDRLYGGQIVNYALRQHVKPGISGWAQVNGLRGATTTLDAMRRRVEHDLWYVRHYSLLLDIEIVARTLFEIARQRNAY